MLWLEPWKHEVPFFWLNFSLPNILFWQHYLVYNRKSWWISLQQGSNFYPRIFKTTIQLRHKVLPISPLHCHPSQVSANPTYPLLARHPTCKTCLAYHRTLTLWVKLQYQIFTQMHKDKCREGSNSNKSFPNSSINHRINFFISISSNNKYLIRNCSILHYCNPMFSSRSNLCWKRLSCNLLNSL